MTIRAHTPPFSPGDWQTVDSATTEHKLPASVIDGAILSGRLTCRVAAGCRVVQRGEVAALALDMRGGCRKCGD